MRNDEIRKTALWQEFDNATEFLQDTRKDKSKRQGLFIIVSLYMTFEFNWIKKTFLKIIFEDQIIFLKNYYNVVFHELFSNIFVLIIMTNLTSKYL